MLPDTVQSGWCDAEMLSVVLGEGLDGAFLPSREGVLCLCNGSITAKSMLWNGIFTFLLHKAKIFFGFFVNK